MFSSSAVGRMIVYDDDFVGLMTLGKRGFERGADEARLVVERDHHAHRELAHRSGFVRGAAGVRLAVTSAELPWSTIRPAARR